MKLLDEIRLERCTGCHFAAKPGDDLLRELAFGDKRYLSDLTKKARENPESALYRAAQEQAAQRLKANTPVISAIPKADATQEFSDGMYRTHDRQGETAARGAPKEAEDFNEDDVQNALAEFERNGDIEINNGKVVITPKGGDKLAASALRRILEDLRRSRSGARRIEKEDFGVELSPRTRRYQTGDDYSTVDIELTAANAITRCGRIALEPEDFEIREEINESKLCAGIIIDESGSMRDHHRLEAALETSMALSRLILSEPENSLRIFAFSDEVREVRRHAILNEIITGGDTDIKGALAAFRRGCRTHYGDKQAYLITDTEPNNEEGRHLPFAKAMAGVLEEASRYRQENIGLNIIMLSERPELKAFASMLARKNLGRVFFTSPTQLASTVVEDYLMGRTARPG